MTTPDLFAPLPPEPSCGACVHRNGGAADLIAYCSPMGMRKADDAPCDSYFDKTQLRLATARRPA